MSPYLDSEVSTLVFLFDAICLALVFTVVGAIAEWRAKR